MDSTSNVTLRRHCQTKSKSYESLNESDSFSTTFSEDRFGRSLDLSANKTNVIEELKSELSDLKSNLKSTQHELDNIILENIQLRKQVSQLIQEIDILKQICKSPLSSTRRNSHAHRKDPKRRLTYSFQTDSNENLTTNDLITHKITNPENTTKITTKQEISKDRSQSSDCEVNNSPRSPTDGATSNVPKYVPKQSHLVPEQHKLCILSNNNNNKILTIAEDTFQNYQICHYLTPNCGTKKLIENIDMKLKDFTMNDYCLIFICEEDFRQTTNYVDLIITIRETLLKIHHTNIIICAPTFKLNDFSTLFNGRIETFNSLMYLDASTYNFAYLFDSNFYLTYDYKMFWKKSGSVNNHGMTKIFENLSLMIEEFVHFDSMDNINQNLDTEQECELSPLSISLTNAKYHANDNRASNRLFRD